MKAPRSRLPVIGAIVLASVVAAAVSATGLVGGGGKKLDLTVRVSNTELATRSGPSDGRRVIRFGFDLRASPEEDARQYIPLLKYLERATGYRFRLRFTPKGSRLADDLGNDLVDIAAVGAVSFIRASGSYGAVPLVRGLNTADKATYRSMIAVARDSGFTSVADLRGKRFAFGSIDSTQGHLIPRIMLSTHGIDLGDFAAYEHTGSHQNCANAVISGRADACGMQDTMAQELAREGKLRLLLTSRDYPASGIAASRELPAHVIKSIRKALLDFQPNGRDRNGLHNWRRTEMPNGFSAATLDDYADLRGALIRLGLFTPPGRDDSR